MEELMKQIREFVRERDWEQFHSPKNLAMALSVEVAEIAEIFQWMTQKESKDIGGESLQSLEEEIGDVMIYLANLADKFGLDPIEAAKKKLLNTSRKYPAEIVRGNAKKYSEYDFWASD